MLSTQLRNFAVDDQGSWAWFVDKARLLDAAGFDRLAVSDHVVFGERLDEYGKPEVGGMKGGKQPTGPDGHWLEPMTTLAVVAGATSRIRLFTGILIAALRRPVVLAKEAATLDVLSGGRLDLGVGVGWQKEEYDAAGLAFGDRGRLLDHTLEVCQTLWRDQSAAYESAELAFANIHMMPKPVADGGVPIWVSGTLNQRVIERVARFGAGWIPWGDQISELSTGITGMKQGLEALGRDPSGLEVTGNLAVVRDADGGVDVKATMAGAPALVEIGVTDVRVGLPIPDERAAAEDLLTSAVAAFRAVTGG